MEPQSCGAQGIAQPPSPPPPWLSPAPAAANDLGTHPAQDPWSNVTLEAVLPLFSGPSWLFSAFECPSQERESHALGPALVPLLLQKGHKLVLLNCLCKYRPWVWSV